LEYSKIKSWFLLSGGKGGSRVKIHLVRFIIRPEHLWKRCVQSPSWVFRFPSKSDKHSAHHGWCEQISGVPKYFISHTRRGVRPGFLNKTNSNWVILVKGYLELDVRSEPSSEPHHVKSHWILNITALLEFFFGMKRVMDAPRVLDFDYSLAHCKIRACLFLHFQSWHGRWDFHL